MIKCTRTERKFKVDFLENRSKIENARQVLYPNFVLVSTNGNTPDALRKFRTFNLRRKKLAYQVTVLSYFPQTRESLLTKGRYDRVETVDRMKNI